MRKLIIGIMAAGFTFSALADTVDLAVEGQTSSHSAHVQGKSFVLKNTVDFSVTSRNSNDVLQVVNVPADALVLRVGYIVHTAEGETITFDIGDGSDADGFIDGANLNSAATGVSAPTYTATNDTTIVGYSEGKLYAADDTIDVTLIGTNTVNVGKLEVFVYGVKLD